MSAKEASSEQAANNWLKSAESDVKSSASAHNAFAVCAFLTALTSHSTARGMAHCALACVAL